MENGRNGRKLRGALVMGMALLTIGSAAAERDVSFWYSVDNNYADALAMLEAHPGTVSSVMLYCGYNVNATGHLYVDAASTLDLCTKGDGMIAGLKRLNIAAEVVVNAGTTDLNEYEAAFGLADLWGEQLLGIGQKLGLSGWNIDWEPQKPHGSGGLVDAEHYATWLTTVKGKLASGGIRLTACVADWGGMINHYDVLSKAGVRLMDMETYNADSFSQWLGRYHSIVTADVPRSVVGIGLGCWIDKSTNGTWSVTPASAKQRIDQLLADDVPEAAMFRLLPSLLWPEDFWWPELARFRRASLEMPHRP